MRLKFCYKYKFLHDSACNASKKQDFETKLGDNKQQELSRQKQYVEYNI